MPSKTSRRARYARRSKTPGLRGGEIGSTIPVRRISSPSSGLPFQRARRVAAQDWRWPSSSIESSWRRKVVKSLGETFGSLTTVPVTETARARSPSRALSFLPGASCNCTRCKAKKAAATSRWMSHARRSRETNDGSEHDCRPKQSGRQFEKFGEQDAAERGNRRPVSGCRRETAAFMGGRYSLGGKRGIFPPFASPAKRLLHPR